VQYAWCTSR